MVHHGSLQHQKLIAGTVEKLRNQGYNAININGTAPDAIAVKENKIYAVEVLIIDKIPKKGWEHLRVVKNKYARYHMFDDVIFKVSNREIKILSTEEKEQLEHAKRAQMMVTEYLRGGI